jgi:hypothetical protein
MVARMIEVTSAIDDFLAPYSPAYPLNPLEFLHGTIIEFGNQSGIWHH